MTKLIYNPELDNPKGGVHPLCFSRPIARVNPNGSGKNKASELELASIWLLPGVNELLPGEMEFILAHPKTSDRVRYGAFKILEPAVKENPTGTLADYSLADAKEIVNNTHDTEVLALIPNEDRRSEVIRWVRERVAFLQKTDRAALTGDSA